MIKKLDIFVTVVTILIYGVGSILVNRGIGNIYYIAGIFSIVILFKALADKGFNPGNYLFYCIIVLIAGMVLDSIIKRLAVRDVSTIVIYLITIIGAVIIGLISNQSYLSAMAKGLSE